MQVFLDELDSFLYTEEFVSEKSEAPSRVYSLENQNVYIIHNIVYKITNLNEVVHTYTDDLQMLLQQSQAQSRLHELQSAAAQSKFAKQSDNKSTQDHHSSTLNLKVKAAEQQSISKWKLYGRQFLSMDTMFEALFQYSKKSKIKLRIPLSTLIDYKGYRCLAIAKIPIRPDLSLTLGLRNDSMIYEKDEDLKEAFSSVGKLLCLKENMAPPAQQPQTQVRENIPVSFFVKVYTLTSDKAGFSKTGSSAKKSQFHFTELEYMDNEDNNKELCYVLKSSEIFPYDHDMTEFNNNSGNNQRRVNFKQPRHYLRPEYMFTFDSPHQLSANCLKKFNNITNSLETSQKPTAVINTKSLSSKYNPS